nr:butyrophilin subfamily 1 member A1-like isoform X2 [Pelodiscus sinensis]|eukprot:XP_025040212.1 butyrophilin subfamily 1 member A1-like isoform X2 [Pelodiscus sinensis]
MERKAHAVSCLVCAIVLSAIPFAGSFEVTSSRTVTGIVGQDVVLPCQISTGKQPDNMEVQWKKIIQAHIEVVYGYQPQPGQDGTGPMYQGRAVLRKDGFISGNVSLRLKNVQPADEGTYSCIVKSNAWSADTTTELQLAADAPVSIAVLGPQDQGIRLACRSAGWFPKPEVQWVTQKGQDLQAVTKMDQDHERLFNVLSHVTVLGEETGEISCVIQNRLLKTEQKSIILLSGDIFPRVSPWLTAFWVLFIVDLLAIGVCAYLGYTTKRKTSKKKRSEEESLLLRETERKALESARSTTELEFRRVRSYMVPITLDPSYKHADLTLSADGRTGQTATPGALVAVEREGFVPRKDQDREGRVCRWYWEVQVGDNPDWTLGVLSETVRGKLKKEGLESFPEEGCLALRRSEGQYYPSEADTVIQSWGVKPTVIGVFLDLKEKSLSFYSVNSMAFILEIPVEISERLFPFLSPSHTAGKGQGNSLSICPLSDWDFPQTLSCNGPVSQGDSKAGNSGLSSKDEISRGLAQSPTSNNEERAGSKKRPSTTEETTTNSAQSSIPQNEDGAGSNTKPLTTGESSTSSEQHLTPVNPDVKGNSSRSWVSKNLQNLSSWKLIKGDKTEQKKETTNPKV